MDICLTEYDILNFIAIKNDSNVEIQNINRNEWRITARSNYKFFTLRFRVYLDELGRLVFEIIHFRVSPQNHNIGTLFIKSLLENFVCISLIRLNSKQKMRELLNFGERWGLN